MRRKFNHNLFSLVCSFVLGGLLALTASGCGTGALRTAKEIGVPKLRADIQALVTASAGQKGSEIPEAAWPESVRRFKPLAVQRHMDGVLIVTTRVGRHQEGLLVMLDEKEDPGSGGSGVDYDSLEDGLFWCSEKIRDAYIPPEERTNR